MITNINQKLCIAIENYFYTRHLELFTKGFLAPKSKKIHKAAAVRPDSPARHTKSKPEARSRKQHEESCHSRQQGVSAAAGSPLRP
jgi:hypothetical protein